MAFAHRTAFANVADRLALCAAALAGSGLLLGACGDYHWTLDLWAHFRWQYLAVWLLCAVCFALLRRPLAFVATALGLVLGSITLWPDPPANSTSESTVKLLSANLWAGNRDLQALLALVEHERPEVVILIELSNEHLHQLDPLNRAYAHRLLIPGGHFGIGLWSNLPGSEIGHASLGEPRLAAITLSTMLNETPLWIVAAHPIPPVGARNEPLRQRQQQDLLTLVDRDRAHALLIGDLNATPWSSRYRQWQALGLRNGGHWPTPTWAPGTGIGRSLGLPIDHALSGPAWTIVDRRVAGPIGSDHRPLIVSIAPSQR